jgi:hypothetical protein
MEDGDEINAIVYDKSRRINLKVTGQVCLFIQILSYFWSKVGSGYFHA